MLHHDDIALVLSHSGETKEILYLLPSLAMLCSGIVAFTSNKDSTLAKAADYNVILGSLDEVCPLGLAPSTSTTVMASIGDAFAFIMLQMREFTCNDFIRYHPAGNLGRKLR